MPRVQPVLQCQQCGKTFTRTPSKAGNWPTLMVFKQRKYCSNQCVADAKKAVTIHTARKAAVKLVGDRCQTCDSTKNLQPHHMDSNPLNNNPSNIMTLCRSCHTKWHWEHGKQMPSRRSVCRLCGKPEMGRGLCEKHLIRERRHGNPLLKKVNRSRIWTLVEVGPFD